MHSRFSIPFIAIAVLCIAITHFGFTCGNGDVVIGDVDAGADVTPGACSATEPCPTGQVCGFPVGQCAATGTCVTPTDADSGTDCGSPVEACGCDGGTVSVACDLPTGYASESVAALGPCGAGD